MRRWLIFYFKNYKNTVEWKGSQVPQINENAKGPKIASLPLPRVYTVH